MKKELVLLLCVVAGAAGWMIGSMANATTAVDAVDGGDIESVRADNARLRAALEAHGAGLQAVGPGAGTGASTRLEGTDPDGTGTAGETKLPEPFSLEGVTDPAFAVKKFQAYVLAQWARGKAGDLELVNTMSELMQNEDALKTLFASEEEAVRHLYPMIKFLVSNDQRVAQMTETIFETMAADPQAFSEVDKNAIEMFTEGAGMLLPALVSEKRMEKMRGYAKTILETPKESQSKAIQRNRSDIERLLRSWQPPISPEDALAALQAGDVPVADLRRLLAKLKPEDFQKLDLAGTLGPLVEKGDYAGIGLLNRIPLDSRTLDELDRRLVAGVQKRTVHQWMIGQYLRNTKRAKWAEARALVEAGFAHGGHVTATFARSLLQLPERPGKDWVAWALGRYEIDENVGRTLRAAFGL